MATVNKGLFSSNEGLNISFDYDDVTLQILTLHINNQSSRAWVVSATSTSSGKNYTFNITPGLVLDQAIQQNAANRLKLSVTPSGKLDGVEWQIS